MMIIDVRHDRLYTIFVVENAGKRYMILRADTLRNRIGNIDAHAIIHPL
jgi:hypothetical protein